MNKNIFANALSKMTIGQLFLRNTLEYGNRHFICRPDSSYVSYRKAAVYIAGLVKKLDALDVKRGDYILSFCESPLLALDNFLATQFNGAVLCPISPLFSINYAVTVCKKIGSKYAYCEAAHAAEFSKCGIQPIVILEPEFDSTEVSDSEFKTAYDYLATKHSGLTVDDIVLLQPTSGSTGTPKLVIRRHSALTHYASHLAPQLADENTKEPHRYLMLLSMAHSFAYHQTTTALMLGAELAVPNGLDTAVLIEDLFKLKPTILPMPPRVLNAMVIQEKHLAPTQNFKEKNLFPLSAKYIIIGGGKANPEYLTRLNSEGVQPVEIFSTSESSMIAITDKKSWKAGTAGTLLSSVQAKIAADGEIMVKSPGIMLGYFNDPQTTAETFTSDGYYLTGDIGTISPKNEVVYLGRKKDVFNTPEGSNIFPVRIEQMLENIKGVKQAVLVGDGRPYLSAILSLSEGGKDLVVDEKGAIDPEHHALLYKQIGVELSKINSELERLEQVVRFTLWPKEFPTSCYQLVAGAKVRRDRPTIAKTMVDNITYLYSSAPQTHVTCVPGVDRRLRPTGKRAA